MIQAVTYHTEAELRANAKAIRDRLLYGGRKVASANQNAPAVKREPRDRESFPIYRPVMAKKLPLWSMEDTHFDAHETAWKMWKAEVLAANGAPLKAYIRRRAMEMGLTYTQITGRNRSRTVAEARQLLMWEIKTQLRPGTKQGERDFISYPELGRLFGGKDHTTCLHAVRKIEALNQQGKLPAYAVVNVGAV